ncbi:spore germination protein PA [Lentibacillus halodurans]|uniref:Spore germination protein PA n=1 Tax=Lentibacillus halodurans TaxID=237679 RepID=A0A1I0W0C7_9BACI|nr:spore germination protein [Lentibacillus halodurans]SFA82041.1 spore germination protein PA [Lentibacillus halodurans]
MPAKVGAVKVNTIDNASVFNIGDVYSMCPESTAKTYAGGGSFITGDRAYIRLGQSMTYVSDQDKTDQNIT